MTKTLTKSRTGKQNSRTPGIKDGKKLVYSVENAPDGYTSKVEKINDSNVIKVVNTSEQTNYNGD